jgi:hypothetical protein
MAHAQTYLLQFYRDEPGDLGITDSPHRRADILEETLGAALLSLHNNQTIAQNQRPRRARAITSDGISVSHTMEVRASGVLVSV